MNDLTSPLQMLRSIPLLCVLVVGLANATGRAQDSMPNSIFEVFQLKQVDATNAAQILNDLLGRNTSGFRCSALGPQRLVVMGSENHLSMVRTTLKSLDVGPAEAKLKVFPLRYVTPDSAAQVLNSLDLQLQIAGDNRTNALIVRGPDNHLATVQTLIQALDQASGPQAGQAAAEKRYRMDLVWLMEGPSDALTPLSVPVQSVGDSVREIQQQGFAELLQAGQAGVAVRGGGRFEVQSNTLLGRMEVQGSLRSAGGKLSLLLSIHVWKDETLLTSLSTEITTEPGHQVVLGIAGAVLGDKSRRSAFVVRVTE